MNTPLRGGAMNEPALKFNRETGRYELAVTISVDAEIFRRLLYRYAEENHLDPMDDAQWRQAKEAVARADKWFNHPHALVQTGAPASLAEPVALPVLPTSAEPVPVRRSISTSHNRLTAEEEANLRARALATPIEQWDALRTPLLSSDAPHAERDKVWRLRHAERQVLEQLKSEKASVDMDRVKVIAEAVNGARLK